MSIPRRLEIVRQDLPEPIAWLRLGCYPPGWTMATHAHPYSQVIVVLEGQGRHGISGEVTIRPGDVLVVAPQTAHHWRATGQRWLRLLDISVSADHPVGQVLGPRALLAQSRDGRLRGGGCARLRPLASSLIETADKTDPGAAIRLHGLILLMLGEVLGLIGTGHDQDGEDMVAAVRAHIVSHYADPIDLAGLASVAHVTGKHLCRLFAMAGLPSPMHMVESVRIQAATDLLCHTDIPVTDIAHQVGYPDPRRFVRAFTRCQGCSPVTFRLRHGSGSTPGE